MVVKSKQSNFIFMSKDEILHRPKTTYYNKF